ncbi:MAG: aminotransferase class V-fold PLP-dependent enzyme [Chloroflexota bacterium]|nr:aminotransferase class V-fold PLP-dependent enzyme [Chloroflexota bacterium]
MVSPFLSDDALVAAVREALPATSAGIYLNAGTSGPLPRETARAMADLAEIELTRGRASYEDYLAAVQRMDEARAAVAAILTADVDTVALTYSTTDGMNIAALGLDWQPGDRVVSTSLEHVGGLAPLQVLRQRRGVDVSLVDLGRGGDDERTLAAIDAAITPNTRLVAVSHVTWSTGARLPVRAIADLAHARGALVLVDGAQSAGTIPVDVEALGADAYAIPAQKWLLGPEGMGALWVAPSAMDRIEPTVAGFFAFDTPGIRPPFRHFPDARRFEAGSRYQPSVLGFARSCGWLAMHVGLDFVYRRSAALAARFADGLAATPGVEVITPRDHLATLVTFRIEGWPAQDALDELGRRTFTIARVIPETDWLRCSVGFFNTQDELDRVLATVAELARYTPDTLPRRPAITILGQDG